MNKLHPDFEKMVLETVSNLIPETKHVEFLNWFNETNTRFNRVYRNFFRIDLGNITKETIVELFNCRNNNNQFVFAICDDSSTNTIYSIKSSSSLEALKIAIRGRFSVEDQNQEFCDLLDSWDTVENAIASCSEADLIVTDIIQI